jgi:hypothetical protein
MNILNEVENQVIMMEQMLSIPRNFMKRSFGGENIE